MATQSPPDPCPVCGASGDHAPAGNYQYGGRVFDLVTCGVCASVFVVNPVRTDYTMHTADELAIRDYVELNAAVDIIGANVLTALTNRPVGRLLDIGCGFGFGADVARRLAGWDVVGVEPSTYGRRGAEALGLRIYHDYLDASHPLAAETFDAIFSSEVIEHIDNPGGFLAMARSMLVPGGLLVIGTPDAASLSEPISAPERLAVLSPGAHLFVMSQQAMRKLLAEHGFTHVEIVRRGTSMVAYASTAPFELAPANPIIVGRDYTRDVLRDGVQDDSLRLGLTFRLFRYLIDLNELGAARAMVGDLPVIRIDAMEVPGSLDEYMAAYPANVAPLVYYRGMLSLNGEQAYVAAAEQFLHAYLLCQTKLRLAPALAVVEASLLWPSLYHAAVSSHAAGDEPMARALWQTVTSGGEGVPTIWKDLAKARLG